MSQLADLRREFEAISDRAWAVAARVGEERVDTRPHPDSSPRAFRPECPRPPGRALSEFLESQAGILQAIDQAEGLPLDRVKTTSAFGCWIRYGLWSSSCANASHHRRHLWQAERSRRHCSTPAHDH